MSAPRNALGRGLGALISRTPAAVPTVSVSEAAAAAVAEVGDQSELSNVSVDLIDPNPDQPRRHFDAARLEQLSASIERSGVLQPVVVMRSGERYVLLVGERRWRASRAAGLATIPAVIADVDPDDRLELAIIENVQRQDLNAIELANAYRTLADRGATQEEIGRASLMEHLNQSFGLITPEMSAVVSGVKEILFGESVTDSPIASPPYAIGETEFVSPLAM